MSNQLSLSLGLIIAIMATIWLATITSGQLMRDDRTRICRDGHNYIDAVIFFDDHFYVVIGDKYYDYQFRPFGYRYMSDGLQIFQLRKYDRRWLATKEVENMTNPKTVTEGRFLGGFFQPSISCEEDESTIPIDEMPIFSQLAANKRSRRQVPTLPGIVTTTPGQSTTLMSAMHSMSNTNNSLATTGQTLSTPSQTPPTQPSLPSSSSTHGQSPTTLNAIGGQLSETMSSSDDQTDDTTNDETTDYDYSQSPDETEIPFNSSIHLDNDTHKCFAYQARFNQIQLIFMKDDQAKKDYYHLQELSLHGLDVRFMDIKEPFSYVADMGDPDHDLALGLPRRHTINQLLPMVGLSYQQLQYLPIVHDYLTLTVFVIINSYTDHISGYQKPRLYYNSFKYRRLAVNWKYVELDDKYLYTAFLALPTLYYDSTSLKGQTFTYYAIGERTRRSTSRGPSLLFELKHKGLELKPSLVYSDKQALPELFGCDYNEQSKRLAIIVLWIVGSILVIIIISLLAFCAIHTLWPAQVRNVRVMFDRPKGTDTGSDATATISQSKGSSRVSGARAMSKRSKIIL